MAGISGPGMGFGWRLLVVLGVFVGVAGVYWAYNLH
jgi:hypothetical protein